MNDAIRGRIKAGAGKTRIRFSERLPRFVQPLAQVLASVPASAFYPILLIGLIQIGAGLGIGSIALMLLGSSAPLGAQAPPEVRKLVVAPAAPPTRALKYRLLPELSDMTPGNGARP